jgi:hypothetical protein
MKFAKVLIAALVLTTMLAAQTATKNNGAFDVLKSLSGEWEGHMDMGGKQMHATTSFRVVSDGSAILSFLGQGTPHEMVTMFHTDGPDVLATHYCGAHNQPRFRLIPSADPKVLDFDFKDATNLASASDGHMVHVKFTIVDADHHFEDWTFLANGKTETTRFDFHRKAASL